MMDDALTPAADGRIQVLQARYACRSLRVRDAYDGFESLGIADGPLEMDYSFWVVRDGAEHIVIDTGYDLGRRDWLQERPVRAVPELLREMDIDPLRVRALVLTHFHFDHIGHVALFENATIHCARAEFEYWIDKLEGDALDGEFTDPDLLAPIVAAHAEGRVALFDDVREVHPGVTALVVGGHCPGELVVTVRSAHGGVILAADAAHYEDQVRRGLPFFAYTGREEMLAALRGLRQLEGATGWALVPGHDPGVRDRFPARPGSGEVTVLLDDERSEGAASARIEATAQS